MHRASISLAAAGTLTAALLSMCAGCSSRSGTSLEARDFVATVEADSDSQRTLRPSDRRRIDAPGTAPDVIVIGSMAGQDAQPTGDVYLVDQLAGQINGKPVYASEFFRESETRLRQKARELAGTEAGRRQWLVETRRDIQDGLLERVRDEILLAEFRATLTAEQRLGVLAFIDSLRDDLISGNLGSAALANERLTETEGLTIDEKVKDLADQELIRAHIRQVVSRHVHVTPRDIEQYYYQNLDKFQPPPEARFHIIRVRATDEAAVARVESGLASGVSAQDLAVDPGDYEPEREGLVVSPIPDRDYATAQLMGNPALNEAARALSPGQTSPAIALGTSIYWIHLDEIHQPEGRTLYEAQLEIEGELRQQRFVEEHERYFKTLLSRANISDIDEMGDRLFQYAAERFLIRPGESGEFDQR
ncbi:MAG: peptidyl-prolyl cis-trans isomerase [Phycisphaerales bacterium]|nr:peptidyl-prolyl cis-trans isomerase [Phycisphaerales bacterium]